MGQSSPIPAPAWFYFGDVLTIEYRTDAALAAGLLPDSNSPPPRTLARWRSSGPTGSPAPRTRSTPRPSTAGSTRRPSWWSAALPGLDFQPARLHLGGQRQR